MVLKCITDDITVGVGGDPETQWYYHCDSMRETVENSYTRLDKCLCVCVCVCVLLSSVWSSQPTFTPSSTTLASTTFIIREKLSTTDYPLVSLESDTNRESGSFFRRWVDPRPNQMCNSFNFSNHELYVQWRVVFVVMITTGYDEILSLVESIFA